VSALRSLRGVAHEAVGPLVDVLVALRLSPNAVTVTSLGVSAVGGVGLALGLSPALVGVVLATRLLCDILDGQVARVAGRTTRLGAMLNDVEDGLGDVLLYCGLALGTGGQALLVLAALGVTTELVAVATLAHGGQRSQKGPLAKVERMAMVAGVGALSAFGVPTEPVYWLGCGLAAWTLGRRLHAGMRALA
jgi:CDP-diacylglycerol---glycerol-3-phosphate 3-phosphatidyltransferase